MVELFLLAFFRLLLLLLVQVAFVARFLVNAVAVVSRVSAPCSLPSPPEFNALLFPRDLLVDAYFIFGGAG